MTASQPTALDGPAPSVADNAAAKYHHPYTPYDVQMQFMKTVYDICAQGGGQVGLLESPTGTGKSLSLLCGALTWLRRHQRGQHEARLAQLAATAGADEPDWVVEQMLRQRRAELARRWERREARLAAARRREQAAAASQERGGKRRRVDGGGGTRGPGRKKRAEDEEEATFLMGDDDYDRANIHSDDRLAWLSAETRTMLQKAGLVAGAADAAADAAADDDDDDEDEGITIYYASRTHSQLAQLVAELRRPQFPSSRPAAADQDEPASEPVQHIPLSSRQRLCINPAVARLGSAAAINDRCAELQKPAAKSKTKGGDTDGDGDGTRGCPYVPSANPVQALQFRDAALATLPDIEDLHQLGVRHHVCPYYAARAAVPRAEIVTLPYPLLLQKAAREALGIRLDRRRSIVLIDEAHNLMDAVAGVHAAALRLSELQRARGLLDVYVRRFGKKLKGASRVLVGQLGRVLQSLRAWMVATLEAASSSSPGSSSGIVDPTALLRHKGADQINLFALVQSVQEAKLAYKVESYAAYLEEEEEEERGKKNAQTEGASSSPVLHTLTSFLLALTNLSSEGRIFYEVVPPAAAAAADGERRTERDLRLSYLLLSPTHAFASIAAEARAVILAGGTMAPFADYQTHLFPLHAPSQITTLSCGHVIPPENLCVWTLASMRAGAGSTGSGGAGGLLDFSFGKRSQPGVLRDLGTVLLNLCSVVPDGVVVFFPSYGYLDEVVQAWSSRPGPADPDSDGRRGGGAAAATASLWDRLQAKKAVFREARGASSDDVLAQYAAAIVDGPRTPGGRTGALLLSVVGGKMSEGINFADRLGRCVVVVGLPFPNLHAPDWKARMEYMEAAPASGADASSAGPAAAAAAAAAQSGKARARAFYENTCMRAVNQSIGRAIRHRGDYAAIVLCDHRFASPRIRAKLPAWIRSGMVDGSEDKGLAGMLGALGLFFRKKKA